MDEKKTKSGKRVVVDLKNMKLKSEDNWHWVQKFLEVAFNLIFWDFSLLRFCVPIDGSEFQPETFRGKIQISAEFN